MLALGVRWWDSLSFPPRGSRAQTFLGIHFSPSDSSRKPEASRWEMVTVWAGQVTAHLGKPSPPQSPGTPTRSQSLVLNARPSVPLWAPGEERGLAELKASALLPQGEGGGGQPVQDQSLCLALHRRSAAKWFSGGISHPGVRPTKKGPHPKKSNASSEGWCDSMDLGCLGQPCPSLSHRLPTHPTAAAHGLSTAPQSRRRKKFF